MKEQIERVKETDISQSKIDTFGRYFLTYYFHRKKSRKLSVKFKNICIRKVDISDWKALGKTLKSVNYYGSEQTKKGIALNTF